MRIAIGLLRVLGALGGALLVLWAGFWSVNEVLLHGLANNCSDGSPDFDPQYCGVTWTPGFPYLALVAAGLALIAVSVWWRAFTQVLLVIVGGVAVLVAILLLWATTWAPANPDYPEPAGPQVALLVLGGALVLLGFLLGRRDSRAIPA